jgi:hypothetical protein
MFIYLEWGRLPFNWRGEKPENVWVWGYRYHGYDMYSVVHLSPKRLTVRKDYLGENAAREAVARLAAGESPDEVFHSGWKPLIGTNVESIKLSKIEEIRYSRGAYTIQLIGSNKKKITISDKGGSAPEEIYDALSKRFTKLEPTVETLLAGSNSMLLPTIGLGCSILFGGLLVLVAFSQQVKDRGLSPVPYLIFTAVMISAFGAWYYLAYEYKPEAIVLRPGVGRVNIRE